MLPPKYAMEPDMTRSTGGEVQLAGHSSLLVAGWAVTFSVMSQVDKLYLLTDKSLNTIRPRSCTWR